MNPGNAPSGPTDDNSRKSSKKSVGPPTVIDGGKRKVYTVNGAPFVVDARYDVKRFLGSGAHGSVCSAYDNVANERVAIKKMTSALEHLSDGIRVLREMLILTAVKHPNILRLRTVLEPPDPATFTDVYLVTDVLDADLHQIISGSQPLTDAHFKVFMVQLMRSLKYLHSGNIVHRDVKPANLLVSETCNVVLCDFGLSRAVDAAALTTHVSTRWYRAPELLVMSKEYAFPVDMWSAGCVLAELLLRRPLFRGSNYLHQLHLEIELVGTPSEEDILEMPPEAQTYLRTMPQTPPMDFAKAFSPAKPAAIDLLRRLLIFRASGRISAEEAIQHPYLKKLADPSKEFKCESTHAFTDAFADIDGDAVLRARLLETIRSVRASEALPGPAVAPERTCAGTPAASSSPAPAGDPPLPEPR